MSDRDYNYEETLEHKKMVAESLKKEIKKREIKKFLITAWPFMIPVILILLVGLWSIGDFFVILTGVLLLAIPIVPLGFLILFFLLQWIIGKEKTNRYATFIIITILTILTIICFIISAMIA